MGGFQEKLSLHSNCVEELKNAWFVVIALPFLSLVVVMLRNIAGYQAPETVKAIFYVHEKTHKRKIS